MRRVTLVAACTAAACLALMLTAAVGHTRQQADATALAPIVGVWQSDTTKGISARSECAWTAAHGAVMCEQQITLPSGPAHALSLFTYDPAGNRYVFYSLNTPGDPMRPVPLTITGTSWYYGGLTRDDDGSFYRTVNDFSARDSYSWHQESSRDGKTWTVGAGGASRRVR